MVGLSMNQVGFGRDICLYLIDYFSPKDYFLEQWSFHIDIYCTYVTDILYFSVKIIPYWCGFVVRSELVAGLNK